MTREDRIRALAKSLREFAALCPWLEEQEEIDGKVFDAYDNDVLLTGEIRSEPGVTAGMIRRARKALDGWDNCGRCDWEMW